MLSIFFIDDSYYYAGLSRGSFSGGAMSQTEEQASYAYVDRDITISGGGRTEDRYEDWTNITITKNFSLELKTGWNAVYRKTQYSMSQNTTNANHTFSLGNPGSLRWVLNERYPEW
jgi:hypothetical protein